MMRAIAYFVTLLTGCLLFLSGCDQVKELPPLAKQDPLWSEYISMHSPATISREDKIRIRFVNDVIDDTLIGKSAAEVLAITPSIDAQTIYVGKREIEVTPAKKLTSGQVYRVRLYGDRLKGIPKELSAFEFDVAALKQQLEVKIDGLSATSAQDPSMSLRGVLITADTEESADIEKVLSAEHNGTNLTAQWFHEPDNKHHKFTFSGIKRANEASQLTLSWKGSVINVDSDGNRKVDIPALGDFKLIDVRAVQQDRNYIEVSFSESLDSKQNMKGLIHISDKPVTLKVNGSIASLYSDKGFTGDVSVIIEPGIRSANGVELKDRQTRSISFAHQKPQVRFAGKGVILPENKFLSIPFEVMNVNAVQVTAFLVYENNIGQFLQTNKLDGTSEMQRVGRYLWRKTLKLNRKSTDEWQRYALDATELLKKHPGGLYQLTISINRGNSTYTCSKEDAARPVKKEEPISNNEDLYQREASNWDYVETYYSEEGIASDGEGGGEQVARNRWADRDDPCKDAYYQFANGVKDSRNFMGSNIGLIAKSGDDNQLHVIATNLRTGEPMSGVELNVMNFQNQQMNQAETDRKGMSVIDMKNRPFYLTAKKGGQVGYLKLSSGTSLPISHFDVGGEKLTQGIKGIIYGERGVWRPGDDIYLTFVLQDKGKTLPAKHPVTMELYNPKNQLLQRLTNSKPVGDFYTFKFHTSDDALTGNWQAKALLGGSVFTKSLKIETVMPNRLKIDLDFGDEIIQSSHMPDKFTLSSQWLHGAIASNLKADVAVKLSPTKTKFSRFTDYQFDDLSRQFRGERQVIFEGNLDNKGNASFTPNLGSTESSPGMLTADFTTRVFEEGGAFSTSSKSATYHPYEDYVGLRLPKGDQARDMLMTDKKHTVDIAALNSNGDPVDLDEVEVSLYKMEWRWWWDQSGDAAAQFASAVNTTPVKHDVIKVRKGQGKWEFEVKYPEWGRFMVRACDKQGQHCTSQAFYIDWPSWAGKAREQTGLGANMLTFSADKPRYKVGDTAKIQLPEASVGRALVSIENGTRVLSMRWVELGPKRTSFDIPLTDEMSPNVYVNVTLVQPHESKDNDRPIRLYGVIPLLVDDPETKLSPKLKVADEWQPEKDVTVEVSEEHGRAMTYTLAVVDEGLLGLTNYKTPQLHDYFYKKEALGVMTWDLFDEVAGAYGGELERLLALGGSDQGADENKGHEKKRFPPVVKFLGAFELSKGEHRKHTLRLPQYIGAVRVMAVAGKQGAYGAADKSVPVRQPLSMLATLPRVIGPDEEILVPVSLFAMDKSIKDATITIETDAHFDVVGDKSTKIQFKGAEEVIGFLKIKAKAGLGKGQVRLLAKSGEHSARDEVNIDVRSANTSTTSFISKALLPGETWTTDIHPHGLPGTNRISLEVSAVPPMNLDARLQYLIRYPHGCLEQTTSAIFPQIFLPKLLKLNDSQKAAIQDHVAIAIQKFRGYQQSSGGFSYWPGHGDYDRWATNYVGHFMIEANKAGYHVPSEMLTGWLNHQRSVANGWVVRTEYNELDQSYRLYTLALAGKPELGAMNRLRESKNLRSTARWQLAAAYQLAGLPDIANELVRNDKFELDNYSNEGWSYGSRLRDKAIILDSLATLGRWDEAKTFADEIAKDLSADRWLSTQEVSFSLMAMSRFVGKDGAAGEINFTHRIGNHPEAKMSVNAPIALLPLDNFPDNGDKLTITNPTKHNLYVTVSQQGIPKAGTETESSQGLTMEVRYTDAKGKQVDVTKLIQGSDLVAHIKIRNHSDRAITNLALSQVVPSGWQIHNSRLADKEDASLTKMKSFDYQDIRDDRIYTYFRLNRGEEKDFTVLLNASYLGHYYAPGVSVEAMYDAKIHARTKGQWVDVVKQPKP